MTDWQVVEFDRVSYQDGLNIQENYWQNVVDGGDHTLLLLEHNPVITLGRRTDPTHLLLSKEDLEKKGIELYKVDRGGSATYHGPGQLVGYIIAKASRFGGIHAMVSQLLQGLQEIIQSFGIDCVVDSDNPGIWTTSSPPRKLAAVGIQNKRGYTMHGFAINVNLLLAGYSAIMPCGLSLPVSTMSIELGKVISVDDVKSRVKECLPTRLSQNKIIKNK